MKKTKIILLLFVLILTIVITNLPNFHAETILGLHYSLPLDLLLHGGYYFIITIWIFVLIYKSTTAVFFFLGTIIVPALLEFSQALIPGRNLSVHDFLANYLGIAVGLSACYFIQRAKKRSTQKSEYSGSTTVQK